MWRTTQEKLRGLCLAWLVWGAFGCGSEPEGQASGGPVPAWAEQICERWKRQDGTCIRKELIADYEDCMRSDGVPELERLRAAGVRARVRLQGMERLTGLCLEKRGWRITEAGKANELSGPKRAPRSS
jgi:hypothetical protein